jgi:hypothetical protein
VRSRGQNNVIEVQMGGALAGKERERKTGQRISYPFFLSFGFKLSRVCESALETKQRAMSALDDGKFEQPTNYSSVLSHCCPVESKQLLHPPRHRSTNRSSTPLTDAWRELVGILPGSLAVDTCDRCSNSIATSSVLGVGHSTLSTLSPLTLTSFSESSPSVTLATSTSTAFVFFSTSLRCAHSVRNFSTATSDSDSL